MRNWCETNGGLVRADRMMVGSEFEGNKRCCPGGTFLLIILRVELYSKCALQFFLSWRIRSCAGLQWVVGVGKMAKINGLEKMSYAELADMEREIARLKVGKQSAEREALREQLSGMAKEHGF